MSASELRRFSTGQLLEELVHRRNTTTRVNPEHWCHNCAHFETWDTAPRKGACPSDFNPCTKGHAMKFIVPEDYGDEYGYYRTVCVDREAAE